MIRLKLWRIQSGHSQAKAAALLGIGYSTLGFLETGRLKPSRGQVEQLRKYFGSETDSLFDEVRDRVEVGR